jgi:hypothetical protein
MAAVVALPGSADTRAAVVSARPYLEDPSLYATCLPRRTARDVQIANISPQHAEQLLAAGIVEPVAPSCVRGRIHVFTVPEPMKLRHRIIQHTADINIAVPPAPPVAFRSIPERCALVHAGTSMLQLDFKADYTQFQLHASVRDFFCHRLPAASGKPQLVRLCVGPTGQAHMVFVAVATTRHLLAFDHHSAAIDDHIDNVLFVGSAAAVQADARQLAERCRATGVSINEDTTDLGRLVTPAGDWCGLHLDFQLKTVALTTKVIEKLRLSWSLRDGWTWRGFAAHIGLLFYSMQVLDVPVAEFFNLLRFVSNTSRDMQAAGDTLWDQPATVWKSAAADLDRWTALAVKNTPRPVPEKQQPTVLILVDASAHGYGYIALDTITGKTFMHGSAWSDDFASEHGRAKLQRSTFTEPWAILHMMRHLVPQLDADRCLRIGTDSVTAAAIHRRGYSARSFDLNNVGAAARKEFPQLQCEYVHVPGKSNILADALSRGNTTVASEHMGQLHSSLRRLLGDDPADTLVGGG